MPTVFNVGAGDVTTLINDINTANSNGQSNVINLTRSTYDLTQVNNFWYGPDGLPPITSDLTIRGNGATIQRDTSATTPAFRLFYVSGGLERAPGTLTMDNVTLRGGLAKGGDSNGGGGGLGAGGAIFNQGTLVLASVTLTDNEALGGSSGVAGVGDGGGGMGEDAPVGGSGGGFGGSLAGGPFGGKGGAVDSDGGGGGGGFVTGADGGSATANNRGVGGGRGGFSSPLDGFIPSPGDGGDGGGTRFGSLSNAPGGGFGSGGLASGVFGGGGGGGVGGGGGTSFGGAGGYGGFGGGGGGGGVGEDTSGAGGLGGFGGGHGGFGTIGAGGDGLGGAIFNMGADSAHSGSGRVLLVNCTLNDNLAHGGGGGTTVGASGLGGALFNLDGAVTLVNDTLAFNGTVGGAGSAGGSPGPSSGGAVYNLAFGNDIDTGSPVTASLVLHNSILGPSGGSLHDLVTEAINGSGTNTATVSGSHNLVVSSSGTINPGVITLTADPMLSSLQNNGGPTPTQLPLPGSPVLGAGDPSLAPSTDQRGVPRPPNGPTDLGSVQVSFALSPTPAPPPRPPPSSPSLSLVTAILGVFLAEVEKDIGFGDPTALQATIDFDAPFCVLFGINIAPFIEALADSKVAEARAGTGL